MRKGDDMDMNWQTMLHEAANASFEKDIEVRSAADNDAYSCVDLPKAKIRELSEKILHLPHQGIVLLFSRYCFRLSPQETEKFFQMKNAKGRFRFYRELLSTSMGLTKTYTGTMGITYRTRVVVTTGVDKIDATSTERTV